MNKDYYSKNLDEDEDIIKVVRRHPITMAGSLGTAILLLLIDFFLLTWLFSQGWWGIVIFIFVFLLSSLMALRSWIIWSRNAFIITNKRVVDVDQHGFFHKVVSECNYDKVQDVSFTIKGVLATIFHFGSIEIQTAGNQANLELKFIKWPNQVQEMIMDQQRENQNDIQDDDLSKEELLKLLQKVQKTLGEKEFKRIIKG